MKKFEFDAIIKKHENMDAAYIEFPYDTIEEFGTKGQVKVMASFDGFEYRGSLANMGMEHHCLGLVQKIRKEIGRNPGDMIHVIIIKDEEPRSPEIPEDLMNKLDENSKAKKFFNGLSYTNQKLYANWITNAKRTITRDKRLGEIIDMLLNKTKCP
jgi:hypothetical protein